MCRVVRMDPESYLALSAVDLVQHSEIPQAPSGRFNFFFASKSLVSKYLHNKQRSGNCWVMFAGRLVVGPRWEGFLVSLGVYMTLVACVGSSSLGRYSVVLDCLFYLSSGVGLVMMLLTALTNPGIMPRNESLGHPAETDPKSIDSTTGFLVPRYLLINGVCVRQKYCRTCRIYRPPRSNHCSICDNCVLKHDHHCIALGTCVGLGNYRWFLVLCASMCVLFPVSFWLVKDRLWDEYYHDPSTLPSAWDFVANNSVVILCGILCVVGIGAFALLFVYHYFITIHNLTTNEHLKKYYKVNPFDYGKWVNLKHALCYPQDILPVAEHLDVHASYRELASTNSECISDFYDY
jgi:palmitoyltransferase ZDHHC9/14/18